MVDLPTIPDRIVTSTAPTSSVSRSDIIGNTDRMAGALSKVADAQMDIATRQAKEQAADDLQQQKVTLNADGSVNVANPTNSLIFGQAGEAYHAAVAAGTIAQHSNVISTEMNDIHQKYPTDPAAFKTAADAWKDKYLEQHGGGEIGQAISQQADQAQTQHYNGITNTTATIDVANQQKSIQANIADQKNTLQGLARQPGGTYTPEFKTAVARMDASYDALGTNPLFRMPKDQIELEKKNFHGLLQGEGLVAEIDSTFTKKGKGDAQKALNEGVLQNPNLSEVDRSRLYTQGMARLAYLTSDAKATIDANRQITTEMESGLAKDTIKPEDPTVIQAIQRAREIGDTEGAQRITAAAAVKQQLRAVNSLPDAIRAEALGVPGGAVNTSLPPEARGLLDTIAKTESAGRYNVRYGGAVDKTFQGFDDHPRVAEPITSGPDVGKTSSAAGRYQFIGSTWDQQAKKLGLRDFSPANQDVAAWDLAQTEYKSKTGKDLLTTLRSGDTADVLPSLSGQWSSLPGGRQPAKQFGGFTADQVQKNPFLISAYVRTLAADPELRVQSAKQTAAAAGKALDNGMLPNPVAMAEVNQAAAMFPDKMGSVADDLNGKLAGQKIASLPAEQRTQVEEQYRQALTGDDVHTVNLAAAALKQTEASDKNMKEHPYVEAENRGWTQAAQPVDPSQPAAIPAALAQRATLSTRIGNLNHTPPPALLDRDEVPQLQAALEGPQGAGVLSGIAGALKPEEMTRLLGEKGFVDSLTAMQSSIDPVKMSTANAFAEHVWQQNAALAEQSLGKGSVDKLQAWQALKGSFAPEELAKRLNQSDDPAVAKARKEAATAAGTELEKVSAGDVTGKLTKSWFFGPSAPVDVPDSANLPGGSLMGAALVNDYKATYTQLRSMGVPADKASDKSAERLKSTWGPSEAAGNQIMKLPPEHFNRPIEGAPNWMGEQLHDFVAASEGVQRGPMTAGKHVVSRQRWEISGLVADGRTESEVSNGIPPSYHVAIRRAGGDIDVLPQRITFDGAKYMAKHEADLRATQGNLENIRSFNTGMPQP